MKIPETKFNVNQKVFIMLSNKIKEVIVEDIVIDFRVTKKENKIPENFYYMYMFGYSKAYFETKVFATKEDLIKSLQEQQ